MLATLAGFLALLLGLLLLVLPLLVSELSRPRDSAWGAVVLLLGLVLVTSAERLTGAPMLAVLCGGLLVGRLGGEVAQGRWRVLSDEERQALRSAERWSRSVHQLAAIAANLLQSSLDLVAACSAWLAERRQGRSHGKRWVRAESPKPSDAAAAEPSPLQMSATQAAAGGPAEGQGEAQTAEAPQTDAPAQPAAESAAQAVAAAELGFAPSSSDSEDPGVRVVADFAGVDALLEAAVQPAPPAVGEPPSSPPA